MVRLFRRGNRRREELLSAYVDGELTATEEREVENVLASSEDARRELAELQATVDLVGQLPELDLPRSFTLDAAPKKRLTLWWPSVRATGLATSVATMLLVGLVAGDMLNVLEQAQFGSDDSEYASDESAFTDAEVAPAPAAAAAMDAPATPEPPMAQAGRAVMDATGTPEPESATTESDEGQSDSSADAPVAAAAQAMPAAPAAGVAKSAAEEETEPAAPAAARMMAAESSEEPEAAEQQAMEDEATQTTATDSAAMEETVAADVSEEAAPEPGEVPQAGMALSAAEEAPVAIDDFAETDGEGLELPLAELQIVTAITIVLLTGATLVAVLRRRRSVP